ncbi:MAG: hypothetical protein U0835_12760 [Isosphaeraceae bacterium]
MPPPRFRIGTLLICVLFLAFGLAALRESSDVWDSLVFTVAAGLLTWGAVLALLLEEPGRRFWLGFSLVGGVYLGASLVPPVESRLLTRNGLSIAASKLLPDDQLPLTVTLVPGGKAISSGSVTITSNVQLSTGPSASNGFWVWNASTGRLLGGPTATPKNFVRIGHSLLALVLAYLSGRLSLRVGRASAEGKELSVDPGQAGG